MNSRSFGTKPEGFFSGKGFYIVLFLCAAVIGVSVWMMVTGNRTMAEDIAAMNRESLNNQRVETVIIPPAREEMQQAMAEPAAPVEAETGVYAEQPAEELTEALAEEAAAAPANVYAWPLSGELDRLHSSDTLAYDPTMRDWRTHEGVDINAPLGSTVSAAHAGTVESIAQDDLFGTVVTVSHGDGTRTVYANLADMPAVNVGDWVELGAVIGAVGDTALGEIGQETHLHFAVTVDGMHVDPLSVLPA